MKFVFIFVALVSTNLYFCRAGNTSGNQKVCPTSNCPININVHGNGGMKGKKGAKGDIGTKGDNGAPCQCPLQNPNKPSAHIEADGGDVIYQANKMIKDWSTSAPYSHFVGGMKYQDGKLTVPTPGRYYIYAQIYYYNRAPHYGRVYFRVNNKIINMIHVPPTGKYEGTLYAGGVFFLKTGDVITFFSGYNNLKIHMASYHSYFGAFLV